MPRPAVKSLGMGLIMGVQEQALQRDSDLTKGKPRLREARAHAPGTHRKLPSAVTLIESSQQPRKPGSVINPTLVKMVPIVTEAVRGRDRA